MAAISTQTFPSDDSYQDNNNQPCNQCSDFSQGKGRMNTYWLVGKTEEAESLTSTIHSEMFENISCLEEPKLSQGNLEEHVSEQQRPTDFKEAILKE